MRAVEVHTPQFCIAQLDFAQWDLDRARSAPGAALRTKDVVLNLQPPPGDSVGMAVYQGLLYLYRLPGAAGPTAGDQDRCMALTGEALSLLPHGATVPLAYGEGAAARFLGQG
ncbi:hypothetical protein E7T06_20145 [Deinococcus sp. Arct2-2]|uniref:hypothetical protein n=1 Tax=Deinococcus sp. Arct2-2 TaxID=2568653 RepID=UPI0010A2D0B8|nr:hypothetical protein [Deinococcus sp. Arct2-2]THF67613.1 hypothetical protein E7T06_20145 [Deinococcus sp. Arct2-2]